MRVGEKSVTSEFLLRDIITLFFLKYFLFLAIHVTSISIVMIISCHSMSLPVAETRGGGEDVVLGEQEAAARGPVPACHRHRHQPGPGPITASASKSSIRRFVMGLVSIVSYSLPSLMMIASRTQFHIERPWGQRPFSIVS